MRVKISILAFDDTFGAVAQFVSTEFRGVASQRQSTATHKGRAVRGQINDGIAASNSTAFITTLDAVDFATVIENKHIHKIAEMALRGKLNVQSFPRPPLLEKVSRHIKITWNGQDILETDGAYWVLETHHPPSPVPSFFACEVQIPSVWKY